MNFAKQFSAHVNCFKAMRETWSSQLFDLLCLSFWLVVCTQPQKFCSFDWQLCFFVWTLQKLLTFQLSSWSLAEVNHWLNLSQCFIRHCCNATFLFANLQIDDMTLLHIQLNCVPFTKVIVLNCQQVFNLCTIKMNLGSQHCDAFLAVASLCTRHIWKNEVWQCHRSVILKKAPSHGSVWLCHCCKNSRFNRWQDSSFVHCCRHKKKVWQPLKFHRALCGTSPFLWSKQYVCCDNRLHRSLLYCRLVQFDWDLVWIPK